MKIKNKDLRDNLYTFKVGLFCASLIVISYIFLRITWAVFMTPLWETISIAVFLFFFLQIKAIRIYLTTLPKPLLKAYFIFFFIFCICHCIDIPRTTFPFVPWNMFSDETRYSDLVKFFRYEAITQSGKKVTIRPELYFRSLSNGRIVTDLDNLVSSIILYDPVKNKDLFKRRQVFIDDYASKHGGIKGLLSWFRLNTYEENLFTLDEKKQHLNEILNAIALRYNAGHPEDPLSSIDIIKGTVDISKGTGADGDLKNVWHLNLLKGAA